MLRQRGREGVEHHVDVAGDDVVDRGPEPAIGHVHELDARPRIPGRRPRDARYRPVRAWRPVTLPGLALACAISALKSPAKFVRVISTYGTVVSQEIGTQRLES